MSSRVAFCALLLLSSSAAVALDWGDVALRSDRSLDGLLVGVMNESDLETALAICAGVSRREDVFAGTFIEAIAGTRTGSHSLRSEMLLRELLDGLFDPLRASPALPVRAAVNVDAIELLLGTMNAWNDPQLAALLVRILPVSRAPSRLKALMSVGERITRGLKLTGGALTPQERSLALDYLASAGAIGSTDFLEQCVSIARFSTDADLVRAARTAAASLKGSR